MATKTEAKIVISAEDKASKVLGNIASVGFKALAAAAAAAAAAVGAFSVAAIKEFIDSEAKAAQATQALTNALKNYGNAALTSFKDGTEFTGKALAELQTAMQNAGKAALKLGFDDDVARLSFSKLLLVTGDTEQAMKDLQLAQDIAAYSGRSLEDAAKAVGMVHAGNTRVLKEFGIEVKDGMTATDALAMAQDRLAGSAEAMANTTQGKLNILRESWANLKEGVGKSLVTAVEPFIETLTKWATDETVQARLTAITTGFAELVKQIFEAVKIVTDFVRQAIEPMQAAWENLQTFIKDTLKPEFNALWATFVQFVQPAFEKLWQTISENLWPALVRLWETLQPLKPFLEVFAKLIGGLLYAALIAVVNIVLGLVIGLTNFLTIITEVIKFVIDKAIAGFNKFTDALAAVITAFRQIVEWAKKAWDAINPFSNGINIPLIGKIGGKAAGGPVSANTPYLVGERGAELFVPGMAGNIIPNHQLAMSGVGGGANITLYITGNTFMGAEGVAEQIGEQLIAILRRNVKL